MATEKRLIEARWLSSQMYLICEACQTENIFIDAIIDEIDNAPDVDAVEVVHGRWEPRTDVPGFVRCSACHDCNIYDDWPDGKKWNYCPNCGAKMDGGFADG